jgi:thiaminase (transcriptional activator TenA)
MLALLLALSVTDQMWDAAKPTYEKTISHPFLRELADGSLAKEKFERYLIEDIAYLRAYGEVLTALAVKAPRPEWKKFLLDGAAGCDTEVKHIHQTYLGGRAKEKAPSEANAAYIRFLKQNVEQRTFAEGLAAVLPCYWIYWEVGKTLKTRGSKNKDYQRWIDYYSDPAYGKTVAQVLKMMNEASKDLPANKLIEMFVEGAGHEYSFWDSAYHLRR